MNQSKAIHFHAVPVVLVAIACLLVSVPAANVYKNHLSATTAFSDAYKNLTNRVVDIKIQKNGLASISRHDFRQSSTKDDQTAQSLASKHLASSLDLKWVVLQSAIENSSHK